MLQCFFCRGLNDKDSRGLLVYMASYLEATLIDVPHAFNESLFLMLKGTLRRRLSYGYFSFIAKYASN